MRDTFNDQIIPATEEDLIYPDESSEFFDPLEIADVMEREFTKELEEKKNIDFNRIMELQKHLSEVANTMEKAFLQQGEQYIRRRR